MVRGKDEREDQERRGRVGEEGRVEGKRDEGCDEGVLMHGDERVHKGGRGSKNESLQGSPYCFCQWLSCVNNS